jgi:predicted metal-dependent hydrolase
VPDPELLVRRVAFEYPDDTDPSWNHRMPEFAFGANSVSLLMPYAEPYFVKAVRKVLPKLDGALHDRTEDFLHQELQHHLQHRRFNDIIATRHPSIRRLEGWMKRWYGWLSRTRSERFNLAFAAASETIAFSLARWAEDHLTEFFDDADPVPATLFLWHLAEEVEHKTVAFDVWEELDGSRVRYVLAMLTTFSSFAWFTALGTLWMVMVTGRWYKPVTWFRLLRWSVSLAMTVLPDLAVSAMPSHHPSGFSDPVWLTTWLKSFDPETGTMPLLRPDDPAFDPFAAFIDTPAPAIDD